jgi:hypothetical protein
MNPEQPVPNYNSQALPVDTTTTPQPVAPAVPVAPLQPIQSVYPQVPAIPTAPAPAPMTTFGQMREQEYKQASSSFNDLITLLLGLFSFSSYILFEQIVKNFWASVIVANIVSFGAIFYANKNYKNNGKISPLGIVGISAATFTFVMSIMAVVAYALIRSRTRSYY